MRSGRRSVPLLLAAAITAGCPGGGRAAGTDVAYPATATDDPRAEAEFREAREAFDAGNAERAAALYQRFLLEHPDDPLVPLAHLGLAQLALARGDADAARAHLVETEGHPDPAVEERARFYEGVALHLAGDSEGAIRVLRPYMGRTTRPEETVLLRTTLATASERVGDTIGALEALDGLERGDVPEPARVDARAGIERIVSNAPPEVVDRAAEVLPREGLAWRLAAKRAAREAYEAGRGDRARDLLALLEQAGALDDDLRALALRTTRTPEGDPGVIGAILPLSGRGQEVGQRALRGLLLAGGHPGEGPAPEDGPRLVLRDDGGDPARAVRALEELVTVHRAIAVLGPVDAASARAVARRAGALGAPVVTLAPGAAVAETGPLLHELFPRPEAEIQALLSEAVARGARRVAILRPEHAYGAAVARAVRERAPALGADVVTEVLYAPGESDLRTPIRALLDGPAFDAIVLPETPDRVAVLAPALALAGVRRADGARRNARLLLPSTAWRGALPAEDPRPFEGALVSVPFDPRRPGARAFAEAYVGRYGAEPDVFAALAYDGYRLLRRIVDGGATSRADVAEGLGRTRLDVAAGPARGLDPETRRPARPTTILEVREGRLVSPRPAGDG